MLSEMLQFGNNVHICDMNHIVAHKILRIIKNNIDKAWTNNPGFIAVYVTLLNIQKIS